MRGQAWMWMTVLMLGFMGDSALAQATKTREGKVKSVSPSSIQLEGATADAPPLTYVVDTTKPQLTQALQGIKAGDSVRLTYAPNDVGAKVVTDVRKQ
ncbi:MULTISPECIES: hypothetical protein [unclassified Corallococcus]|uniref:hypothetical protein n=1 Tax=unclassified Corallococcus TaxID=2685029 RepID=UPI001A8DCF12|nr:MULTISPECIES: hypothetical protein [unclassified Corallococcus]MBN9685261.1 hypothetical protein [Corallococcus sp. NCSPR001]WAS83284.1 hypothetical protein O0N60_28700 [Corallococcus sp. NCRR]